MARQSQRNARFRRRRIPQHGVCRGWSRFVARAATSGHCFRSFANSSSDCQPEKMKFKEVPATKPKSATRATAAAATTASASTTNAALVVQSLHKISCWWWASGMEFLRIQKSILRARQRNFGYAGTFILVNKFMISLMIMLYIESNRTWTCVNRRIFFEKDFRANASVNVWVYQRNVKLLLMNLIAQFSGSSRAGPSLDIEAFENVLWLKIPLSLSLDGKAFDRHCTTLTDIKRESERCQFLMYTIRRNTRLFLNRIGADLTWNKIKPLSIFVKIGSISCGRDSRSMRQTLFDVNVYLSI